MVLGSSPVADFVKFIYCKSGLTREDLCNEATEALNGFGFDIRNCGRQGCDGPGAASVHANGRSALIFREDSKALYTYCASHRLNFVTGTPCKISTVQMYVIKDTLYF